MPIYRWNTRPETSPTLCRTRVPFQFYWMDAPFRYESTGMTLTVDEETSGWDGGYYLVWPDDGQWPFVVSRASALEQYGLAPGREDERRDAELREALAEALDTWDLYPQPLARRVRILLDLISRDNATLETHGIEEPFLALLAIDPDATIGGYDAEYDRWPVQLAKGDCRPIYGASIREALERAAVALKTQALETILFPLATEEC